MTRAKRDLRVHLGDILAAIERIDEYTMLGSQSFLVNGLVQDAVIRQLSVLGEAAAKLPITVRSRYPDIPWKSIIGMRKILIGDSIPVARFWEIVEHDVPPLRRAVEGILATWPRGRQGRARSRPRSNRKRVRDA